MLEEDLIYWTEEAELTSKAKDKLYDQIKEIETEEGGSTKTSTLTITSETKNLTPRTEPERVLRNSSLSRRRVSFRLTAMVGQQIETGRFDFQWPQKSDLAYLSRQG